MDYLVQMAGVFFVMALMAALLWLLKRRGIAQFPALVRQRGLGQPVLQSVDRLILSPQHSLHVIRIADRAIVIGVSPAGCTALERLPWSDVAVLDEGRK